MTSPASEVFKQSIQGTTEIPLVSRMMDEMPKFPARDVGWKLYDYDELPDDFFELRRHVFCAETGLLPSDGFVDHNDKVGQHLLLRDLGTGALMASVTIMDAEISNFGEYSGFSAEELRSYFYATRATVNPEYRGQGLFFLLMYMACRHYRISGRQAFVSYLETDPTIAARKFLPYNDMPAARKRQVYSADGESYELGAVFCDINETMSKTFQRMSPEVRTWVSKELMTSEIEATVNRGLKQFFASEFCKKVFERSLTKREYVVTMANNHQFVRWTTRLVAKIVSDTQDAKLRKHMLGHLNGEIDHEVWIENDLRHLGVDVDYVRTQMVPNQFIHTFMCVQESTFHFTRNSLLSLAVPIAIEAVTAFMPVEFINALKESIRSWGVQSPSKACTFLAAHISTDGGEEGHWRGTLAMIGEYLRDERDLAWMLNVINMVFDSVVRAYNSYVSLPPLDRLDSKIS